MPPGEPALEDEERQRSRRPLRILEKLLLECEGRCSWSRLFKAPTAEIIKQYPQYPDFLRAKRQMDPCNVFSNAFSDSILFPEQQATR